MRRSESRMDDIHFDAGILRDTIHERNNQSTEMLRLSAETDLMPLGVPTVDTRRIVNLQPEHDTLDNDNLAKAGQRPIIKGTLLVRAAVPVRM